MRLRNLHFVPLLVLMVSSCDDASTQIQSSHPSELSQEEIVGLEILTKYAANLIGQDSFPDLDPYEPSPEEPVFRNMLKEECPNGMDAVVVIGRNYYMIGPQPAELIAGDGTNHVNQRLVRKLDTPGVVRHCEIVYDYTTNEGVTGSVPARYLQVERVIDGRKVSLIFSTKRSEQKAESGSDKAPD